MTGHPTGMFKSAITSAVRVTIDGLEGDHQADRRVHGGPDKAVHLFPARHYARLARQFPEAAPELVPGSIGENLSSVDIDENDVHIGDVWLLGESLLQVCQPRSPCWKIDERFASEGMAAFIARERLTGWYWRVLKAGQVAPGDTLELHQQASEAPTLGQALLWWQEHRPAVATLERLAGTPGIATAWREKIRQRLQVLQKL